MASSAIIYDDRASDFINNSGAFPVNFQNWYNSSKATFDDSFGLGNLSGSSSEENANNWYLQEYQRTGDKSFLETYIQNLLAQQNTESARAWEAGGYKRQINSTIEGLIENGLNPWLAVQGGIPGVSSGSSSVASNSSKNITQTNREKSADRASSAGKAILTALIIGLLKLLV